MSGCGGHRILLHFDIIQADYSPLTSLKLLLFLIVLSASRRRLCLRVVYCLFFYVCAKNHLILLEIERLRLWLNYNVYHAAAIFLCVCAYGSICDFLWICWWLK